MHEAMLNTGQQINKQRAPAPIPASYCWQTAQKDYRGMQFHLLDGLNGLRLMERGE